MGRKQDKILNSDIKLPFFNQAGTGTCSALTHVKQIQVTGFGMLTAIQLMGFHDNECILIFTGTLTANNKKQAIDLSKRFYVS